MTRVQELDQLKGFAATNLTQQNSIGPVPKRRLNATDPRKLFAEANQELQLTARFKSLLEQFIPSTKSEDLVETLTA